MLRSNIDAHISSLGYLWYTPKKKCVDTYLSSLWLKLFLYVFFGISTIVFYIFILVGYRSMLY